MRKSISARFHERNRTLEQELFAYQDLFRYAVDHPDILSELATPKLSAYFRVDEDGNIIENLYSQLEGEFLSGDSITETRLQVILENAYDENSGTLPDIKKNIEYDIRILGLWEYELLEKSFFVYSLRREGRDGIWLLQAEDYLSFPGLDEKEMVYDVTFQRELSFQNDCRRCPARVSHYNPALDQYFVLTYSLKPIPFLSFIFLLFIIFVFMGILSLIIFLFYIQYYLLRRPLRILKDSFENEESEEECRSLESFSFLEIEELRILSIDIGFLA